MTQLIKGSAKITCIMRLTFQLLSNCRHAQTHTLYTTVSFCKLCNILFFYSLTGAELIMELAPVLKQFVSKHFPLQVNLCQKLLFLQNIGKTCCVQKLF